VESSPPPPPPSDVKEDKEEEKYQEQLKNFKELAEFSSVKNEEEGEMMEDDGSVEVSPPENYERMAASSNKDGGKKYGMIAGCLLVILAVVLGIGFGTGAFAKTSSSVSGSVSAGNSSVTTSSSAPGSTGGGQNTSTTLPPDSRQARIRSFLASKSPNGGALFADPTSPESQALQWLENSDPLQLDPSNSDTHVQLEQRYALLTLWFGSPNNWFNQTNWLNGDECSWWGVTCDVTTTAGRRNLQNGTAVVTRLELKANNVQGNIPEDLALLTDLEILNLEKNSLKGTLPSTMSALEKLLTLTLSENALTGKLAGVDFSKFSLLQMLDLSSNQLVDSLPDTLWQMPNMGIMVLDNNNFSGSIPSSISNLQNLGKSGKNT